MNIYISKIKSISHKNKYTNWYVNIINSALNRLSNKDIYYEKHHIIPKSFKMGGEKDKSNLVHLTAREHFIVHMLLVKMTVNTQLKIKMSCALTRMMNKKYNNSKTYETARKLYSKNHPFKDPEIKQKIKEIHLEKYGVEYPSQNKKIRQKTKNTFIKNFGVDHPSKSQQIKDKKQKTNIEKYGVNSPAQTSIVKEKTKKTNLEKYGCESVFQNETVKEKIKKTCLKKYGVDNPSKTQEIKNKIEQINLKKYGTKCSLQNEDIKQKSKETCLRKYGVDSYNKTPISKKQSSERMKERRAKDIEETCPHCGFVGKGPTMKQWHFDRCKNKKYLPTN